MLFLLGTLLSNELLDMVLRRATDSGLKESGFKSSAAGFRLGQMFSLYIGPIQQLYE